MENRKPQCNEKKSRRKEVLEKRKAIDGIIKAASTEVDHLASFQPFKKFERNGVSLYLDSGFGDQLSSPMRKYIQDLLKANMEGPYGPDWPAEEKVKRREMVAPEARYIFVRRALEANPKEIMNIDSKDWERQEMAPAVGFVQYRFVVEEEVPTLYVYELQLEPCVQRKGLGKFLMQLIELIARKNHMGAVMLTVQKANIPAMRFYMTKLRYEVSAISPSRVDPLIGAEKSYEILCKTFHPEARQKLEKWIGINGLEFMGLGVGSRTLKVKTLMSGLQQTGLTIFGAFDSGVTVVKVTSLIDMDCAALASQAFSL